MYRRCQADRAGSHSDFHPDHPQERFHYSPLDDSAGGRAAIHIFAEALLLQLSIYENISAFYIHLRGEFWNGRFVDIRQRCIRFKNSILCSAHPLIVFEKYEHVFYRIA